MPEQVRDSPSVRGESRTRFFTKRRRGAARSNLMRHFKLKKPPAPNRTKWLNRQTVYEGKLLSMTKRVVRLFAPDPADPQKHVDLSYDWVTPVRSPGVSLAMPLSAVPTPEN